MKRVRHHPEENYLKAWLRVIPDWPKEGVNFIDITTLLKDPLAFKKVIDILTDHFSKKRIDCIVGIEARGFMIGSPVAYNLGVSFIPARKVGKLPYKTKSMEYTLEYNTAYLEMHSDAIKKHQRVAIIDDLLATGGTSEATVKLVENLGGEVVGLGYLIELDFLKARKKFARYDIFSLVHYDS
ncbi:MAG: adenine phosphoribosyltransferase [Nitrososphaerales archaeon]